VNPHATNQARLALAAVAELLESRTQAQPAWNRKALRRELARLGYWCSLRSVARYVNLIRTGAAMMDRTSGEQIPDPVSNNIDEREPVQT
jgi:hypothetical protein